MILARLGVILRLYSCEYFRCMYRSTAIKTVIIAENSPTRNRLVTENNRIYRWNFGCVMIVIAGSVVIVNDAEIKSDMDRMKMNLYEIVPSFSSLRSKWIRMEFATKLDTPTSTFGTLNSWYSCISYAIFDRWKSLNVTQGLSLYDCLCCLGHAVALPDDLGNFLSQSIPVILGCSLFSELPDFLFSRYYFQFP